MNIYLNCKSHLNERADCSVRALARGLGVSYDEAHLMCEKKGRKRGGGFSLSPVFGITAKKKSRQFKGHRIGYNRPKPITVERFARLHPTGTFIICVHRHYLNLLDGKLFDLIAKGAVIKYYFRISKVKSNDNKSGHEGVDDTNAVCEKEKAVQDSREYANQKEESENNVYQGMESAVDQI